MKTTNVQIFGGILRTPGRRRGSTLLIVIALLSLLVLMAATIAYTSKLEVLTTRNFGKAVQNQTSALTGVPFAAFAAKAKLPAGAVGTLDFTFDGKPLAGSKVNIDDEAGVKFERAVGAASQASAEEKTKWIIKRKSPGVGTTTGSVDIADAASRVNLNTADAQQLATIISLAAAKGNVSAGNAPALAERIVAYRLGPDGAPGVAGKDDNNSEAESLDGGVDGGKAVRTNVLDESPDATARLSSTCEGNATERINFIKALKQGTDEPDEYISDIRYPAFGDDRRFQSVADLARVGGISDRLILALAPYVTTFSVSQEQRPAEAEENRTLLDLNRATAQEIYDALALEYSGEKDDILLRQFAVNVVDARDEDRRPTMMPDGAQGDVLGLERTPFITEIYADSRTDDRRGDDGQFVELFNPWKESFALTGWTVRVGKRDYPLTGTLGPQNYLIITDDYKNDKDPAADEDLEGEGSFYDVFRIVSNNSSKRVLELVEFDLPHTPGSYTVELRDDTGAVVDRFVYAPAAGASTLNSFQRYNPLIRESAFARATPFSRPADPAQPTISDADLVDKLRNAPQDLPFTSVLQLFDVFAGYAQADGTRGERMAFPVVASSISQDTKRRDLAGSSSLMDARMIDLFTIETSKRMTPKEVVKEYRKNSTERLKSAYEVPSEDEETGDRKPGTGDEGKLISTKGRDAEAAAWARFSMPTVGLRQGLINVNTAGEAVLQSAGFTASQAASIVKRRREVERDALLQKSSARVLYNRLSDVLVDENLWGSGEDTCQSLRDFTPVFDRLTVTSRAFLLEGHALESSESGALQNSPTMVSAVVAMDKPAPELVGLNLLP
ncbi:MAG TPA: type II secretion system protein GspK [Candidatus Sumerlaeota bacterium]|nr:type II secretion system protein GspK [Candidatus Sumerlaeota bacterium]